MEVRIRLAILGIALHAIGPYDAIHVGAAAPILPATLVEQLASPGRMFIPVGTHSQEIIQVDKDEHGNVSQKKIMDVRVSLVFPIFSSRAYCGL